jgi:hypothetical protein
MSVLERHDLGVSVMIGRPGRRRASSVAIWASVCGGPSRCIPMFVASRT